MATETSPHRLGSGRCLADHRRVLCELRQKGRSTAALITHAMLGVTRALAREFSAGRMVLRFRASDIVYDHDTDRYAIAADLPRYSVSETPSGLSLLDNGIHAPELTRQITRPVSAAADVYALGAILYSLASGVEPSSEFTAIAESLPPARIFEPHLPLGIDPIFRRCLARLPENRFSDPEQLLLALEEVAQLNELRSLSSAERALEVTYGSATHPGINKSSKNPNNQDQFLCAHDPELGLGLFVVADGVSTCDIGTGDRAAALVMESTRAGWEQLLHSPIAALPPDQRRADDLRRWSEDVFHRANQMIFDEALAKHGDLLNDREQVTARIMSSTAVAVVVNGRHAHITNVGDSRVYLIRESLCDQATVDHDRRTALLREGQGYAAIDNASGLGSLTRAVGMLDRSSDTPALGAVDPEHYSVSLLAGDQLLICSDGVPDCIGTDAEQRIQKIVLDADRPALAVWNLIVAANEGGGDDNITAILLQCTGKETASWPMSSLSNLA